MQDKETHGCGEKMQGLSANPTEGAMDYQHTHTIETNIQSRDKLLLVAADSNA